MTSASTTAENATTKSSTVDSVDACARSEDVGQPLRGPSTNAVTPELEAVSDQATSSFIRRTLCTQNTLSNTLAGSDKGNETSQPVEALLPPLTSSNEVDLQLYAIIAVILKEFVFTWYSKITPDHVFVDEVIQIIAHCTRGLESRLRRLDLEALLLDEIPELVRHHVNAYRIAQSTSSTNALGRPMLEIYHTLNPHPALVPVPVASNVSFSLEQRQNEIAWRQMVVQGILAVLLPTEDLENGCLRTLVAEILSEMILGAGVGEKACEGWLLWEAIAKITENLEADKSHDQRAPASVVKHELDGMVGDRGASKAVAEPLGSTSKTISIPQLFLLSLQYLLLVWHTVRTIITAVAISSSLPLRGVVGTGALRIDESHDSLPGMYVDPDATIAPTQALKRPIVSMSLWSCVSHLLEFNVRMPWLAGIASLLHWGAIKGPGRMGDTNGLFDRLLSHYVQTILLKPALLPPLLRSVRIALFPRNAMGPARSPPTEKEIRSIKQRCAQALVGVIPRSARKMYFATSSTSETVEEIEAVLDILGDKYCNKTLIYSIIELVIVRLVPELRDKGVTELLEERLGELSASA